MTLEGSAFTGEPPGPVAAADGIQTRITEQPILSRLWAYWTGKRAGRAMPRRADFAPHEIPDVLPHLAVIGRGEGGRLYYRLMGTAVVQAYGFDATGKYFDRVFDGPRLCGAIKHCTYVFDTGRPLLAKTNYASTFGVQYLATRLVLPLGDDSGHAIVLIIGNVYERDKELKILFGDAAFRPDDDQITVL